MDKASGPYIEVGREIARVRDALGQSQGGFAKTLGVSQKTVSNYETGDTKPKRRLLPALAKLGADVKKIKAAIARADGLIEADPATAAEKPKARDPGFVPVIGAASCGAWIEAIETGREPGGEQRVEFVGLVIAKPGRIGVVVKGKSMSGSGYADGDVLVVDFKRDAVHGKPALVCYKGEITVKEFRRHGDLVVLKATNPDFRPQEIELRPDEQERISWAHPIVFHRPAGSEP